MLGTGKPRSEMGADQIADLRRGLDRIFFLAFLDFFAKYVFKKISDLRAAGGLRADPAYYS